LSNLACTPERDQADLFAPEGVGVLVIDAALIVDQSFPVLRLTRTLAPNEPYTLDAAGESGASISITRGNLTVNYGGVSQPKGGYYPTNTLRLIEPGTEYVLSVVTDRGETLTARTVTPERLSVDSWVLLEPDGDGELRRLQTFAEAGDASYTRPENRITYAEGLIEARFAAGGAGFYGGFGYQLALFSIDSASDYVIEPAFFEEEDYESLSRFGASPAVTAEDGLVRLPWFGVFFQGRHLFKTYVVDENWYDFLRSTPETDSGLGFGGNAGDSMGNPIFHVEGGIGLFGSASVDSVGFFVLPPETALRHP
jgi:uncharacterized protein DUF4249